ncbi:MAG: NAD(+)/NADH kinase [Candidatus Nezhaarchaeales archaeon]
MVSRQDSRETLKIIEDAFFYLKAKGVEVLVDQEIANFSTQLDIRKAASSAETLKKADIIMTFGGDGTILQTIKRLKPPLKILGINMGRMGFLCEVEPKELNKAIDKLLSGKYQVQRANLLSVKIDGVERDLALNDVLVLASEQAKILDLIVKSDDIEIFNGRADGVLVSSTIGCTAYVLSLGGPLVDPCVECMITVILNPLMLGLRPIILPSSSKVEILIPPQNLREALAISDGVAISKVNRGSIVEVSKSSSYVDFIRIRDYRKNFYKKFYEVRIRGGKK